MDFEVVTLFPEMFESFLAAGLLGKAVKNGTVKVSFTNPRDFAPGAHRKVDEALAQQMSGLMGGMKIPGLG